MKKIQKMIKKLNFVWLNFSFLKFINPNESKRNTKVRIKFRNFTVFITTKYYLASCSSRKKISFKWDQISLFHIYWLDFVSLNEKFVAVFCIIIFGINPGELTVYELAILYICRYIATLYIYIQK